MIIYNVRTWYRIVHEILYKWLLRTLGVRRGGSYGVQLAHCILIFVFMCMYKNALPPLNPNFWRT